VTARGHDGDAPVVPQRSDDDQDRGWGGRDWTDAHPDDDTGDDTGDDERLKRERPPHW
jgi:hypothetical protein